MLRLPPVDVLAPDVTVMASFPGAVQHQGDLPTRGANVVTMEIPEPDATGHRPGHAAVVEESVSPNEASPRPGAPLAGPFTGHLSPPTPLLPYCTTPGSLPQLSSVFRPRRGSPRLVGFPAIPQAPLCATYPRYTTAASTIGFSRHPSACPRAPHAKPRNRPPPSHWNRSGRSRDTSRRPGRSWKQRDARRGMTHSPPRRSSSPQLRYVATSYRFLSFTAGPFTRQGPPPPPQWKLPRPVSLS